MSVNFMPGHFDGPSFSCPSLSAPPSDRAKWEHNHRSVTSVYNTHWVQSLIPLFPFPLPLCHFPFSSHQKPSLKFIKPTTSERAFLLDRRSLAAKLDLMHYNFISLKSFLATYRELIAVLCHFRKKNKNRVLNIFQKVTGNVKCWLHDASLY